MSLAQLQKIRERRMEKQQTEVLEQRQAVAAAQATLAQTHQQVEQFHQWRLNHQDELFRSLQGQPFSPHAMLEYRATLEALAQQEEQLKTAIPIAQQQVEQALLQLQQAQRATHALVMKNEKTKEILATQKKAETALELYKELNQDP